MKLTELSPNNRLIFAKLMYNRIYKTTEEELIDVILSNDPENYYDMSASKYYTYPQFKKVISDLCDMLNSMGWKTKKSYGDTALFIYCGETAPKNCW